MAQKYQYCIFLSQYCVQKISNVYIGLMVVLFYLTYFAINLFFLDFFFRSFQAALVLLDRGHLCDVDRLLRYNNKSGFRPYGTSFAALRREFCLMLCLMSNF